MARAVAAALVLLLAAGPAAADRDDDPLYRPAVNVHRDPDGYYSPALFERLGEPAPGQWRAEHPEPAQSLGAYRRSGPNRPTRARHTIVLQPLGGITPETREQVATLQTFLGHYYALPVRTLAWIPLTAVHSRPRTRGPYTWRQYLTGDILRKVLLPRVARGTFCLQGITNEDLYPEEDWNYVFGSAGLKHRVGVYSLARLYPAFWHQPDTPEVRALGLRRSLKVVAHEIGHMFGLHHCQTFRCLMNGTNHLAETDAAPVHLCPECLRKLRWNTGMDLAARYEALAGFYVGLGMDEEAAWVRRRLRECRGEAVSLSEDTKKTD